EHRSRQSLYRSQHGRHLECVRSFPTRRSSDLEPAMSTGPVGRRVSSSMRAAAFEYLATSSTAIDRPRMPAPEPPYDSGITRPNRPASRKSSNRSSGYSFDSSISRARDFTLSWARRRTDSWSATSSSDRAKSIAAKASGELGRLAPLADHAAPLLLGGPAPDPVVLTVGEGVLEARLTDGARGADGLGLASL